MPRTQQEELQKLYGSFTSGLTDDELENFVHDSERIMKRPAALLLAQVGLDETTSTPFSLLDNACGTGPIVAHLQETVQEKVLSQSKLVCADFNSNLVVVLKRRAERNNWRNIETAVLDAQKSGLPEGSFSHVTVNFAMHVIPEPQAVLHDTMRILKPGGVFAFTVWHKNNSGWVPDLRSCFEALPFEAPMPNPVPMASNGKLEWTDPGSIEDELKSHGFENVRVETATHMQRIENAEDYLKSFQMMKDWMVNSHWGDESKEEARGMLDDHIVKHLEQKYDGQGWDLTWTLILATCQKPLL